MRTLNLGILAHVDAGKTSLTERLLYTAGVIDEIGSVDDGTTQTDTLALERQRGITIKSAVVSFAIDDVIVNLIDTPGHPDFIAEVERVLSVLDGAVLVISAVEGVQSQTRVLMRALQRLHIPTLIFVNKIDRMGADSERVLHEIATKLTPGAVAMGSTRDTGTRKADTIPYDRHNAPFVAQLTDLLADHDDAFLAAYVANERAFSYVDLRAGLATLTARAVAHPVFFGSAITGAGVERLMSAIREFLPECERDAGGPVSGSVFKIERGAAGERIAYVRLFSGALKVRDVLQFGGGREGKVTAISVFDRGSVARRASITAGQIGKLWGLSDIQIGDAIGIDRASGQLHHFAPPTLQTVVVPRDPGERSALHVALSQLAEQDPLINLGVDDIRQELSLSLYGEVQKEVIQATLANEFDIDVEFLETTTICVERPMGSGAAVEKIWEASTPFAATVGLRVEPGPVNSGVQYRLDVELGSLPLSFHKAVEETVRETLRQGLYGWTVTDCTVTMTHSGYSSPVSTARDFRNLTPLVLMRALEQAGTLVCEPVHRFHLELPADTLGVVLPALARMGGVPQAVDRQGPVYLVQGEIPAARMHDVQQRVPSLTRGEGVVEFDFDRYEEVNGTIPTRARSDHNPLDRKEYLLHIVRRV
jgi:ribosomal protection tetracycline resistance protein